MTMKSLTNDQPTVTALTAAFMLAGGLGYQVVRKTVTFNNTVGTVSLFTVTGDVIVRVIGVVKTGCASALGCNASVGIAGATANIIALTDITLMAAEEIWHDVTPDSEIENLTVLQERIISDGNDIILTLSAQADSGAIAFYCLYTPLSANGLVVAAP